MKPFESTVITTIIIILCFIVGTVFNVLPVEKVEKKVARHRISLPEKCEEFYLDGTDNWINCMGVGLK